MAVDAPIDDGLLQEAIRRGLVQVPDNGLLAEAQRRGLVPAAAPPVLAPSPAPDPTGGRESHSGGLLNTVLQGATLGLSDEVAAAGSAAGRWLRNLTNGDTGVSPGQAYDQQLAAERKSVSEFNDAHPIAGPAIELASGFASGAPVAAIPQAIGKKVVAAATEAAPGLLSTIGKNAAFGGGVGATAGFAGGEGGFENRAGNAAVGGIAGATLGAALPVAAEVLSTAFRKAANVFGMQNPERAAQRQILRAFERDGITPEQAMKQLADWNAAGAKPEALIDLGGENVRALAQAAAAIPSEAKSAASKLVVERQAGQSDRIANDLSATFSPNRNFHATADELRATRSTDAQPLYEKAFQGGSMAPFEKQFEQEFGKLSAARAAAEKELRDADMAVTLAKAQTSRAGDNVYGTNAAGAVDREATTRLEAARQALQEIDTAKAASLERLKRAQEDGTANVPGAVWSPRIQQFLDDPITKAGLAKGLKVQRLEALAQGKPFNPTEFAITGTDAAGEPIVGAVPNMRTLDAVKRGLDEILDQYRSPITGKIVHTQESRAVDSVRRSFLGELDGLNPDYPAARAAWSGPSQSLDALSMGRNIFGKDSEITDKMVAGMSPNDREFFKAGVVRAVKDLADSARDGADITKRIFATPKIRDQLRAAFDSNADFRRFADLIEREAGMYRNAQTVNPRAGSRTGPLLQAVNDMGDNPVVGSLLDGLAAGPTAYGDAKSMLRELYRRGQGMNAKTADSLAPMMFNPENTQDTLQKLAADQLLTKLKRANMRAPIAGMYAGIGAGAGTEATNLLDGSP